MKIIDFSKCELSNRNLEYAGRAGEKRIPITKILDIVSQNNKESIFRVYSRINENMDKIKSLIDDIPTEYNAIEIMSNARKEYYLKTIDIRIEQLLKKYL